MFPRPMVYGETMLAATELLSIRNLIQIAKSRSLPGHYAEAGVWRGGASIFARTVLNTIGWEERFSFVVDSFAGLPVPRGALSAPLQNDTRHTRAGSGRPSRRKGQRLTNEHRTAEKVMGSVDRNGFSRRISFDFEALEKYQAARNIDGF